MKREQLSDIIGAIDDRQIAEAYRFDPDLCGSSPERIGTMKIKRIVTLALAAALIFALGVGGYAIYRGRVQDLVMKSSDEEQIAIVDDGSDVVIVGEDAEAPAEEPSKSYDPLPGDVDMISLQGFAGSPEFQAAQAWAEFQHNYDRDGSVLASVGNGPTPWSEKYSYNGYSVYSQEMADTLEAIAAEHGLILHNGGIQHVDSMAEMYDHFGQFSSATKWNGYYFSDGTFQCDCVVNDVNFQIRRCMKGVLDTVSLNITDAESYEQWGYTTACGTTVLLALGPSKALILAESDQSFTVVNVLAGSDDSILYGADGSISAAELEALADTFDFSIL